MAIFYDNIQVAGNVDLSQLAGYAKLSASNTFTNANTFNGNVTVAAGKKLEVTNALTANNSTLTAANLTVNGATNLNGSTTATNINKLSASTPLPDSASLDDKSLIMSDSTKSYNVNYSTVKTLLSAELNIPNNVEIWTFTPFIGEPFTKTVYVKQ